MSSTAGRYTIWIIRKRDELTFSKLVDFFLNQKHNADAVEYPLSRQVLFRHTVHKLIRPVGAGLAQVGHKGMCVGLEFLVGFAAQLSQNPSLLESVFGREAVPHTEVDIGPTLTRLESENFEIFLARFGQFGRHGLGSVAVVSRTLRFIISLGV